jgi:hypothetical protein
VFPICQHKFYSYLNFFSFYLHTTDLLTLQFSHLISCLMSWTLSSSSLTIVVVTFTFYCCHLHTSDGTQFNSLLRSFSL